MEIDNFNGNLCDVHFKVDHRVESGFVNAKRAPNDLIFILGQDDV